MKLSVDRNTKTVWRWLWFVIGSLYVSRQNKFKSCLITNFWKISIAFHRNYYHIISY